MKRIALAFLALALLPVQAWAAESPNRATLVHELSLALGMEKRLSAYQSQSERRAADRFAPFVAEYRTMGISEESLLEIERLTVEAMKRVESSWNPTEAARIFTTAIATSLTDDEIREAVKQFKSQDARRVIEAGITAGDQMASYLNGHMAEAMKVVVSEYGEQLRAIIKREAERRGAK